MTTENIVIDFLAACPNVRMRDPTTVESKFQKLVGDGLGKLVILSDFDHTLSRHVYGGQRGHTSLELLSCNIESVECDEDDQNWDEFEITHQMQDKMIYMTKKYLNVEFPPGMPMGEKISRMVNWWSGLHQKIIEQNLSQQAIEKIADDSIIFLRENVPEFLRRVNDGGIPFLLFNAGFGYVIKCLIKRELGDWFPNMHLISNLMIFDADGTLVNFTDPLTSLSDNPTAIEDEKIIREEVHGRCNIIMLGDSPGDVQMEEVLPMKKGVSLRIGFLNKTEAEVAGDGGLLLDTYLQEYDVVIIDDTTFDAPLGVLKRLIDNIRSSAEEPHTSGTSTRGTSGTSTRRSSETSGKRTSDSSTRRTSDSSARRTSDSSARRTSGSSAEISDDKNTMETVMDDVDAENAEGPTTARGGDQ